MRISSINTSFIDYPGKTSMIVFMTGCSHKCERCHNPELQDPSYGYDIAVNELIEQFKNMPLCNAVTFSGGDPLFQFDELLKACKEFSKITDICVYTGETLDKVPVDLLKHIKVLKTEPYIFKLGDISNINTNQKIWDIVDNKPIENKEYFKPKEL